MDSPVLASDIVGEMLYMATEDAVFKIDQGNNPNYSDLGAWAKIDPSSGIPEDAIITSIASFNDKLYVVANDSLFNYENEVFDFVHFDPDYAYNFINGRGQYLKAGMSCIVGCLDKVLFFDKDENIKVSNSNCVGRTLNAIEDQEGNIYYADNWRDLRMSTGPEDYCDRLITRSILYSG